MGDSSLLNTSCGFNRVPCKGGPKLCFLNHSMLTSILSHFGFANCIVDFFSDYLVGRSTQYSWNSFLSGACDTDVDVG